MTTRAVEQVDDWDTRPFSGGYAGLHDLAADGFSGIVTAGPTRLCMTKGTVVGVLDGAIEDFEGASGTAHESPSPALPLLAVMQEGDTEVQGQYYTEDTPLSEVDRTLSDGTFTGYIELAENVLSGDYYQVYHQGHSMSVAFVGASGQLLTDDEAFGKADDEVGIYEVHAADVSAIDIPEADDGAAAGGATGAAAAAGADTDAADDDPAEPAADDAATAHESPTDGATGAEPGSESDSAGESEPEPTAESGDGSTAEPASAGTDTAEPEPSAGADDPGAGTQDRDGSGTDPVESDTDSTGGANTTRTADETATSGAEHRRESAETRRDDPEPASSERRDGATSREARSTPDQNGGSASGPQSRGTDGHRGSGRPGAPDEREPDHGAAGTQRQRGSQATGGGGSVENLETRSIPSLDPDRTTERDGAGGAAAAAPDPEPRPDPAPEPGPEPEARGPAGRSRGVEDEPAASSRPEQTGGQDRAEPADQSAGGQPGADPAAADPGGADPAELERLEAELDDREAELEELQAELETVTEERDDLRTTLESVREEREELQSRVEELEARINELRAEGGGESIADRERLSPGEAIDGTNLFVRYASKGDATLKAAHDGQAEASAVNDNLEIQHHTQFEAEGVAVNGEPFEDYLTDTIQYQFVEWVVRVLPYEIRDTGHEGALKDLYDALPDIDRAELNGAVSVQFEQDGEQHRSQERFDIVLRDRMGNPLAVANLNDSRDPATQGMMEDLITASQRVGESKGSLAGSFLVTSSFFQPEAMEAASDATGGGLLSRDKRESFVKLSRKEGFHLCLVEARGEKFNLSVPEI